MNEVSRLRPPMGTRVDEFLKRTDELYGEQRNLVLVKELNYQRKRVAITTEYARKMNDLAHEGAEALRALDAAHLAEMTEEKRKLDVITRMRG